MPRVFISYRRTDSEGFAGRIYDRLTKAFGRNDIFIDTESLRPGENFVEVISREAAGSDVLLALVGPRWLELEATTQQPRIHEAKDYVRQELETAIQNKLRVVPVLLQGASMPSSEHLPISLRSMLLNNAAVIGPNFHQDVNRLIRSLRHPRDPVRGREFLLGIFFGLMCLSGVTMALAAVTHKIGARDFIRLILELLLMCAVYLGTTWARYLLVALSGLAGLGFVTLMISFSPLAISAPVWLAALFFGGFSLFTSLYFLFAYLLLRSSSIRLFLELQRQKHLLKYRSE